MVGVRVGGKPRAGPRDPRQLGEVRERSRRGPARRPSQSDGRCSQKPPTKVGDTVPQGSGLLQGWCSEGVWKEGGGRGRSNQRVKMGPDPGRLLGQERSHGGLQTVPLGRNGGRRCCRVGDAGDGAAVRTGPEFTMSADPGNLSASPVRARRAPSTPSRIAFCSVFSFRHQKLKQHMFAY